MRSPKSNHTLLITNAVQSDHQTILLVQNVELFDAVVFCIVVCFEKCVVPASIVTVR